MRIAVDARHAGDHFPGIGRYVYSLLCALAALDHDHTLLVLHNPALPNTRFNIAALSRSPRVQLVPTGARPFTPAEQLGIPRLLRAQRADLYHAPYYVMPYAGLPCQAVVTLHDIIPRLFPAETPARARLLFDLLHRLALRVAKGVIAVSRSARADIAAAYRVPPERIAVIPHAADERFRPQPAEAVESVRRRYGLPQRYVLCLSSNKPHKNLPALVAAWALSRTTPYSPSRAPRAARLALVIAGHFDSRYPQARELAARTGAAVRFLPDVADADLPALYAGAALFVYPSRYEGFGLPPLEAMACGAPVVCGGGSSLPEVVGDAALVVDVRRPEALAAGIAQALGDEALRERLRAKGLARAASFSWRRAAEQTFQVYERTSAAG